MGTYEKHKQECMDLSDGWITTLVIDEGQELDLNKIELLKSPAYQCDLIKILKRRLDLHKLAYPDLTYDEKLNVIRLKTELEKKNDVKGKTKLSLDDSITTTNRESSKK